MYCGDETGSFVGEVGSHSSRFGYGGDDSPKYCVPSYVASTTTTNTTNGPAASAAATVKKVSVPTSCYNSRWTREDLKFQSALRLAQGDDHMNGSGSSSSGMGGQPVVDPTRYLQQGDSIHDFDAYENLWQSAFDALKVRDRLKHTKGGGRILADGNSGVDDTGGGGDDNAPASTTIRSSAAFLDTKCIHPLLAVSPGCTYRVQNNNSGNGEISNSAYQRKEMTTLTEIFFEKLHAPAVFIAPTPMLAAFSQGRQTALVVDIGAAGCRVTPVVDGLVLKSSQRRNGRGGDWLGNVQWKALRELQKTVLLRPRYQQGKGFLKATSSTSTLNRGARGIFHRWAMQDLMYEFRSSQHVRIPDWRPNYTTPFIFAKDETAMNAAAAQDDPEGEEEGDGGEDDSSRTDKMEVDSSSPPTTTSTTSVVMTTPPVMTPSTTTPKETTYELPDGTLIDLTTPVGRDLCRVPELLFTDDLPFLSSYDDAGLMNILNQHETLSNLPLHQLIRDSLSAVGDVDVRKDLASSILLTGASSLIPNLEQRLSWQVGQIISTAFKPKVLASRQAVERSCASWIGGSVLSSLGSFQQLWLGRAEYEEYGATLAIQRFP